MINNSDDQQVVKQINDSEITQLFDLVSPLNHMKNWLKSLNPKNSVVKEIQQ